jgi:hypothetical protein
MALPHTLCVMPTFQCPAQCRHCGTVSHPQEQTWLAPELIRSAIEQAATAGYREVVFSGGEPTLAGNALLEAMRQACCQGLQVRMVTNAHWATTPEDAAERLSAFAECGLAHLTLSTGDEHIRFIPVDWVLNAARACAAIGIASTIVVENDADRALTVGHIKNHPQFVAIVEAFPAAQLNVVEWTWSPLSPFRFGHYEPGATVDVSNLDGCGRCEEILSTTTLQADGTISPCCGLGIRFVSELKLGNIRDAGLADANAKAARDFLKRWIRAEGPERILAWAAAYDPSIRWEGLYAHRCQACMRVFADPNVRRVIDNHQAEKTAEIDFLESLFLPAGDRE